MKVYLIRHTAVDVPSGTCYGQTDVPLKSTFKAEAAQTLRNLSGTHFDHVYSSPLSRARRLAGYCGYPDPECDDRLMEINFGEWEMQRFDAISDPRLQEWFDDYFHVAATGGESFEDLYRRVAAFLDELKKKPCKEVGIFAHGGVLICAQIYAGAVQKETAWEHLTPYGGVISIDL